MTPKIAGGIYFRRKAIYDFSNLTTIRFQNELCEYILEV